MKDKEISRLQAKVEKMQALENKLKAQIDASKEKKAPAKKSEPKKAAKKAPAK
jgi:alpha-amylase